ncbi:importin [Salix suchowensis]|nr:importin [Salix suchowensis]
MDVLNTSILIPKGIEGSEQGEKVTKKVKDKTVKERKIASKVFTDVVEEFREEALK